MNKFTVYGFKKNSLLKLFKEDYSFLIMFLSFIVGICIGVFLLKTQTRFQNTASNFMEKFISVRQKGELFSIFINSLSFWLPFFLAVFVCGTSFVGMVLSPIFIFYKGAFYGIISGYLYSQYSFKGIIFNLIFIIIPTIIGSFALFLAGKQSVVLSISLARMSLPNPPCEILFTKVQKYIKIFIFLLFIILISALCDGLLTLSFFSVITI